MNNSKADYDFFNVGTGNSTSIKDVAATLFRLCNKNPNFEIANRCRVGDIRHCYADISKIKKIGFQPKVDLEEGLKKLTVWGQTVEAIDKIETADLELERRRIKV